MKTLNLAFVFFLISMMGYAQQGEKNFIDQNYIEVTGEAEKEVVPNEIYLAITIDEGENPSKNSLEELEKKMFAALRNLRIDLKKDLTIKDLSSNFKEHWIKKKQIKTTKDYLLKTDNTRLLGKVVTELEKLNISNIHISKVDHSEIIQIKTHLKMEAVKAAQQKAQAMASVLDQNCGRAIYIIDYPMPRTRARKAFYMQASDFLPKGVKQDNDPQLDFEAIHLEARVMVRFVLK